MQNIKNIQNLQGLSKTQVLDSSQALLSYISNLPGISNNANSAYYPLNETSGDAINRAPATFGSFNGTVSNATQGAAGSLGKAYSFDGSGDRVIIPSIAPSATFSFSLAFKRNGAQAANDRILDQASGGPTRGWHIGFDAGGDIDFQTWNNSGAQLGMTYGAVADDEWVILGGSIGASSSILYLNGAEIATGAGNSFGTGIIADLQFGCRSGGTSNPMAGSMQHVAIASGVEWSAAIHDKIAAFFLT